MVQPVAFSAALLLLSSVTARAAIRVPADYPTIGSGLAAASAGDTVIVACGIYYEHGLILSDGVVLTSASGDANCVTIDAQGQGRVLTCDSAGPTTALLGMTITGGAAQGSSTDADGGGAYCDSASPLIENCVFAGNTAAFGGGGVCCSDGASPAIVDCRFEGNTAVANGGGLRCRISSCPTLSGCVFRANSADKGGALWCWQQSSPELRGCLFDANTAVTTGGAAFLTVESDASLYDCTFIENEAGDRGGGIFCWQSSATLEGCLLADNSAVSGGLAANESSPIVSSCEFRCNTATVFGGAILAETARPGIQGCTIRVNSSLYGGGVAALERSGLSVTGSTITFNAASVFGGGVYCHQSSPWLHGCIVSFSASGRGIYGAAGARPSLCCSDVVGNSGGDYGGTVSDQAGLCGNISEDPLFCDPGVDDLRVQVDSSCAPENNICGVLIGAHPVGCGTVAVRPTTWGAIKATHRQ
jgi:predicted outer membrane repeat protein